MFSRFLAPAAALLALTLGQGQAAEGDAARLEDALRLREVFSVMSEEGSDYGAQIEADMFPGAGGPSWVKAVNGIYSVDRILPIFDAAFETELAEAKADVPAMIAFFESDLGRKVTTLEISGRRALLDKAVEDASRLKYEELSAAGDAKMALVDAFVDANDLVEANVAGAMNANYAFYRGLGDAGVLPDGLTDDEIIAEIWAQEESIRGETDIWIRSYLAMAYAPLSDAEIRQYAGFSDTPAGKDLNAALFAGFDAVFTEVSHQLGRAAGGVMAGQEL
ncbi:hypothetical protein [Albidovulum sp.]|uniref:hypothetical protein n=1 Tax=Albidovulum sp. TaxID=1872424 RepID=UPI0039B90581